jgi:hypothetical protein
MEKMDLYYLLSSVRQVMATGLSYLSDDKITWMLFDHEFGLKDLCHEFKPPVREHENEEVCLIFDDTTVSKFCTTENNPVCRCREHSRGRNLLHLLCAIFFVSVIFSCKTDTKEIETFGETDFSETVELTPSVLTLDQMLMRPLHIHLSGDFLFLQNHGTAHLYEVYDLNTNRRINECISVGQGPGEMVSPAIVNIDSERIWIYDLGKASIFEYKTEDFVSGSNPPISKTIKLNAIYLQTRLSGDTFIASSLETPKFRFDFFNSEGKLLYSNGTYPPNDLELSDMATKRYYDFNYAVTSDSKIFTTHFYTDLIEIYDVKGNLIRRRQGPNRHQPKLKEKSVGGGGAVFAPLRDETYQCYSNVAPVSVKDEVFVLYSGELFHDFIQTHHNKCDRILVFDTDGNPLRIYKLKTPVMSFAVDGEKRIIYGITDEPEIEENEFDILKYEY